MSDSWLCDQKATVVLCDRLTVLAVRIEATRSSVVARLVAALLITLDSVTLH